MHQSSFHIITRFRQLVDKHFTGCPISILDVGSYGVNGTYKEIFADTTRYTYTGLDVNPGPNVDYVPADPYAWPELADESFDVIVSGQAFEHIEYPWLIIEEMSRVLKKNGLIGIVAPSRGPEHKYPVDCWRYYPDAFRALAKWASLDVIETKTNWGKSGFNDGSDQWGDTFCMLTKSATHHAASKQEKKSRPAARTQNSNNPLTPSKQDSYYGFARPDVIETVIQNHLPTGKILEIGCAGGLTGKNLKERLPVQSYTGIDISAEAAQIARQHLDQVIVADIEQTDLASEHGLAKNDFDLLLALDVLEHLYNPWDALAELSAFVKPGGYVVSSLPNIQNISILQDLTAGQWPYQDAGILDATHLRFFTLEEAKKLFTGSGLVIKDIRRVLNPSIDAKTLKEAGNRIHKGKLALNELSKEEVLNFFTYQYIMVAQKPGATGKNKEGSSPNAEPGRTLLPKFEQIDFITQMTSIVILTYNELSVTKECVQSIRRHTPENHEIIFVDNGSKDGTVKWLKSQIQQNENYRFIENEKNLGFAKGCNQGIEASRGEYILLLNNDVVVADGWLAGLLKCHSHAPDAGIVGPMTNNISGLQKIMNDDYHSVKDLEHFAAKFEKQYRDRRIPLRRIVGFCMLFKRTLVEKIGLLDESFGTGNFEDDDLCLRAELAGHQNYIAGDVFIHHYGSRSFIANKINYRAAMSGNRQIIEKKWTLSVASPEGRKLAVMKAMDMANNFYHRGKTDQAVEALIHCIRLTPEAEDIYYALCRIFIESKRFSEAQEVIDSMPETVKNSLKGMEFAGYIKEGLGLDHEADLLADKILAMDPAYAPALNLKGALAFKNDDKEKARALFQKATQADPGYGEPYTNLGIVTWGMDQKEESFSYLQRGFILSPTIPDISSPYYSVAVSLGKFADVENDFRDASRLYPNNRNILFLLIDALIQQEKFSSAMTEIENALEIFGLDDGTLNAALTIREKIGPREIKKGDKKNSLSVCMIVKNEEKHLLRCLKSVRDVADEIIIVDTGSTDKTKDIATVFGARVFDFPWTGDFSQARNESLRHASGSWILIMDADEAISPLDYDQLRKEIGKGATKPAAYIVSTRNYTNNVSVVGWTANTGEYPEEASTGWVKSDKVRLYTRRDNIFFTNPVHELLENSLKSAKVAISRSKVIVHHYGKLDIKRDEQKGQDYYLLGRIKYESDPNNVKYIYELAKQAQVLKKDEEAVELWLKLLSKVESDRQSADYREIARISFGEPVAEIYMQLASAYIALECFEDALAAGRKAIETPDPRNENIHVYAHCEIIAGSPDKALQTTEDLLKKNPDYIPAQMMKAIALTLQGEKSKALDIYQALLKKGARITINLNTLARQFILQGKKEKALQMIEALFDSHIHDDETARLKNELLKS